eukprot:gb/GECG01014134.1/.p1 GENE.gb/GECG01014134.1/~~gb/GECG01014134.1/.p1  ORF type:complete len:349 (+),score=59.86 gb/GECG01014134.1/:1-1047(+)
MSSAAGNASGTSRGGEEAGGRHQQIHVHPIVLLSVSDQYTRIQQQEQLNKQQPATSAAAAAAGGESKPGTYTNAVGVILGTQSDKEIHINFASDLRLVPNKNDSESSPWKIDIEYLEKQVRLITEVHPEVELLGWYMASASEADPNEVLTFHHQLKELNENPLMLMLDPRFDEDAKELPVSIYISQFDTDEGKGKEKLVKIPYKIDITEAERSTINNVSNTVQSKGAGGDTVSEAINSSQDALKMFRNRTNAIIEYLIAVKEGKIQADPQLLRSIAALSHRLPVLHTPFAENVLKDIDANTELVSLLSTLTTVGKRMSDVLDKHDIAYEKRHGGSVEMLHHHHKFMYY